MEIPADEYIPNQPIDFFLSEQSAVCPDLMFGSSTLLTHHVTYIPPMWTQLHHERRQLPDTQIMTASYNSESKPTTSAACTTWRINCGQCNKRFNSTINLENHVDSVHKGIRPFKCQLCGKTFAQRATLRTHMRIHTGEKPYGCEICGRKFADLSTCKKHQRVHDGQKPYVCPICSKRFSQSGNMLRHKEGHERRGSRVNIVKLR